MAEGLLGIEPVLLPVDMSLDALIRRAGASPSTRVVGVVDASGVLVGVVDEAGLPTGYVDGLELAAAVEAASPDSPAA